MLMKEEIINNLKSTTEIINEIIRLEVELKRKEVLLQVTIEELQSNYLKKIEDDYLRSIEYKSNERYQKLTERFKNMDETIGLVNTLIITLICLIFIHIEIPLLQIAFFWLVTPSILYLVYCGWKRYYLNRQKSALTLRPIDEVLIEAKESAEYQQLPESILPAYIRKEINGLNQKKVENEKKLASQSSLPPLYQMRAKEVIWHLENGIADNLKEAIIALERTDKRKKAEQMLEIKVNEIEILKDKLNLMIKEN